MGSVRDDDLDRDGLVRIVDLERPPAPENPGLFTRELDPQHDVLGERRPVLRSDSDGDLGQGPVIRHSPRRDLDQHGELPAGGHWGDRQSENENDEESRCAHAGPVAILP